MLSPFDQFVQNLLRVGLVSGDELHADLEGLPSSDPAADVALLTDRLVARGKLTRSQAKVVLAGKPESLVLGNYLILEKLGAGGMGTVYKAVHRRMKRTVAIKVLPRSATRSADEFERFQREVEAVARLNHPNIVTAFDADEGHLGQFLVMEYVEGSDLDAIVRKHGPLPIGDAVDATIQAARALAYAHSHGVVHRDIKPANLLRDVGGTIKVADLGLARFTSGLGSSGSNENLTQAGTVFGTVDYMSPEQALDSKTADNRSDIYSLGCALYFLLTGKPLYESETLMGKLIAHRERPIPALAQARPAVPVALDRIFQRMVAKQPAERYQSMTEVIRDLEATNVSVSVTTRCEPPTDPREWSAHLVEPSRAQSLLIGALLRSVGLTRVESHRDGHSTLHSLRARPAETPPPELVLCAMHLPDMTGIDLLQALRADPAFAHVGFLLISSEVNPHHLDALRHSERVALLPKPFNAEQLKLALAATVAPIDAPAPTASLRTYPLEVLLVTEGLTSIVQVREVLGRLVPTHLQETRDRTQALSLLEEGHLDLLVTNDHLTDGAIGALLTRSSIAALRVAGPDGQARIKSVRLSGVLAQCNLPVDCETVARLLAQTLAKPARSA
jgi:eukaryotic-like serine/threonine-protein kinase